ncbi:hypothetical protein MTY66_63360 (plasmid) [Mycolicibacterium sp. TY66]|uniref:hypothetical protein n=1 Tax=unclassified Mycolicibacterium TaxID=2636767 RepID=UPI001BB40822|nr:MULTISPECIES: hypothetical protein [unclassified Mycolicibacterium]BCI84711.1 hypothetical protein MTY66_63360 [Mycolicibacterium sp. TY66]BCJ84940.1 hypothetical protein MTY81_63130 [Mycolicibacterium sp. TY81]
MGTYYEVLLGVRDGDADQYVARIDPGDFPEDDDLDYARTVGAGGAFDVECLPVVVAAASRHFGRPLNAVWVDDRGHDDRYFEPDLPYVVPALYEATVLDDRRALIHVAVGQQRLAD